MLFVFLFSATELVAQTHFKPVGSIIETMNVNLLEAKVNGANLVAGDEIGIYDGALCVGALVLTDDLGEMFDLKTTTVNAGADDVDGARRYHRPWRAR